MNGGLRLTLPSWLRAAADGLLAAVAAPACAACERPLDRPFAGAVCQDCWMAVGAFRPPLCPSCGEPLPSWRVTDPLGGRCPRCRGRRPAVAIARAIGPYDGALRAIVQALKYGHRRSLARPLAERMRTAGGAAVMGSDVAVPVPLHRRRQRQRGFNQAEDLARGLGLPVHRALKRVRHTPSQTDLPAAERHANVREAFAFAGGTDLTGLVVLLVDDVATTGATLEACAAALRRAGALEVRAVTAARVASSPR